MGVRVDDVLELGARSEDGLDGLGQPRTCGNLLSAGHKKSWVRQQSVEQHGNISESMCRRSSVPMGIFFVDVRSSLCVW